MIFQRTQKKCIAQHNQIYQDGNATNNKQLSQRAYMSLNRRITLSNGNVYMISSCADFVRFVQTNALRLNMNLFINDASDDYECVRQTLQKNGYQVTVLSMPIEFETLNFANTKQAIFTRMKSECDTELLFEKFFAQLQQLNRKAAPPWLVVPNIVLNNAAQYAALLPKYNVHLTLHSNSWQDIKTTYTTDWAELLKHFDTIITTTDTEQVLQYVIGSTFRYIDSAHGEQRASVVSPLVETNETISTLSLHKNECLICTRRMMPFIDKKL